LFSLSYSILNVVPHFVFHFLVLLEFKNIINLISFFILIMLKLILYLFYLHFILLLIYYVPIKNIIKCFSFYFSYNLGSYERFVKEKKDIKP